MQKDNIWKRIDTITKRLYDCYILLEQNEGNKEEYSKYVNILNVISTIETKLYDQLTVKQLEHEIMNLYSIIGEKTYDTNTANLYYIKETCYPRSRVDIINTRKRNRLMIEYNKKKEFNEPYIFEDSEEEIVDQNTGTFEINDKIIYVFDRINEFERIKSLAKSTINLDYIKELENSDNYEELSKIKYNLLFLDNYTLNRYLNKEELKINSNISKQLYDYFLEYYREVYFMNSINYYNECDDTTLEKEHEKLEFEISLIELRAILDNLDEDFALDLYDQLLQLRDSETKSKMINLLLDNIESQITGKYYKKEKIKK